MLKELRNISFEFNVPVVYGAITNYKDFQFVKFNQKAEIQTQYDRQYPLEGIRAGA